MGQNGDTFTYNGKVIENCGPHPFTAKLKLQELRRIVATHREPILLADHNWQTLYNHATTKATRVSGPGWTGTWPGGFKYHGPLPQVEKTPDTKTKAKPKPVVCKKCNMQNDFGEPNQEDGTYVCYNCR